MGQGYLATKFLSTETERMELAQWEATTAEFEERNSFSNGFNGYQPYKF